MRRPIIQIAKLLVENGHSVTILTPGEPSHSDRRESDSTAESLDSIKIIHLPAHEVRSILWPYPNSFSFFKIMGQQLKRADVVHIWAPFYAYSLYPLLLKYFHRLKVPTIVTYDTIPGHSFLFASAHLNFAMRLYLRLFRAILNSAEKLTVYSEQLLPFAQKIGLQMGKTLVLPTGINIRPVTGKEEQSPPVILFVGLLNARKGVGTLLKTASLIQHKKIKCSFILVGSGPEKNYFEKQARNLNLTNVTFVGATTNVSDYYQKASVFFLPSQGEGLPGVIMEAMCFGLPIVASAIPCISDLVMSGYNGFLCDKDSADSFAESIEKLILDSSLREIQGKKSQELIQNFSWSEIFPKYEKMYQMIRRNHE